MANVDPNSAIGQSQKAFDTFAQYFSAMYQALLGQGTFPEFSDSLGNIDYSELHRVALSQEQGSASYPNAAAVENVHQMAAVLREYGIRVKTKNQYWQDGVSDSLNESNFYATLKPYYANMLQGVYIEGATS